MESSGVELSTWLGLVGVIVVFFVLPGAYLEIDRRRELRRRQLAERD
jgi:hypothetical protein